MLKEKPTNLYGNVLLQRSYLSLTYVEKADVRKLHIGKQGLKSFETCSELYQISMRELMLEKKTTKSHVKTLHHKCLKVSYTRLCDPSFFLIFHTQCCPHIETSQLIWQANQSTGFYMRATFGIFSSIRLFSKLPL